MAIWIDRVKSWTEVGFKDPADRVERAMVRVLLMGSVALAAVGLFDFFRLQTPESGYQFAAGALLAGFTLWMDRTGRVYPRTVLVLAALAGYASILMASLDNDLVRLTDASPLVFITMTGVLALVLGGKWARPAALFWVVMIILGVTTARWPATDSFAQAATDAATVLIMSALVYVATVAVQSATQQGRAEYEQLMETAPVGVVEMDLRGVRSWLLDNGFTTHETYLAAVEDGKLDPRSLLPRIVIVGHNEAAGSAMFLSGPGTPTGTIGKAEAAIIVGILARIIYEDGPGSTELSFRAGAHDYHQVMNWSFHTEDRRNVVIISTDITTQKAAEQALADQIRYKDEFIATVSHELRTPLTAVVGLVEELTDSERDIANAEKDELMGIVAEQSHEVANIVEDLLVAARAAGGNLATMPMELDLRAELENTMALFGDEFELMTPPQLQAYADPTRIRQVIRNLATNAVRYGGPNRRVVARTDGDQAIVEVRDDGPPIPTSRRDVMFEPYERVANLAKTRPESVGLGLTVARSLALNMNGDISYDHDGKESVFTLALPASITATHHGATR